VLGSSEAVLEAQQALAEAGFWVVAIRAPTVPRGSERLRVSLSAAHTEAEVDALVEQLARVAGSLSSRAGSPSPGAGSLSPRGCQVAHS
jgi:8-amino-7-oxononanoate synthase